MKIYSRFDRPAVAGLTCLDPTRTQQQFARECDINDIIARALRTGDKSAFVNLNPGDYIDVSGYSDYQDAVEYIRGIEEDFLALPSRLRQVFGHSPHKYVAFTSDPANYEKCVKLGILEGSGEATRVTREAKQEQPAVAPQGPKTAPDASESKA